MAVNRWFGGTGALRSLHRGVSSGSFGRRQLMNNDSIPTSSVDVKRHILLALPRVLFSVGLAFQAVRSAALPEDSPTAMVHLVGKVLGLTLASLILVTGSLIQILLRAKPARYTVIAEI